VPTAETLAKMYIKNPPYVDKNRDEVRATPIENIVAAKELSYILYLLIGGTIRATTLVLVKTSKTAVRYNIYG
jgi:hypothetical protein